MGIKIMEKVSYMRITKREVIKKEDEECTICLNLLTNYTYNNFIVKTECMHYFHYCCLLKSLFNDNRCPNCRSEIIEGILDEESEDEL